jgi:hypothetical protein
LGDRDGIVRGCSRTSRTWLPALFQKTIGWHTIRRVGLPKNAQGFISEAAADHPQIAAEVDELRAENAGLRQAVDRLTTKNDELQAELDEIEVELVEISRCFDVIAAGASRVKLG